MRKVEFEFDVDDIVHVKRFVNITGIVKMCAYDRSGNNYYVTADKRSEWWHEDQLEMDRELYRTVMGTPPDEMEREEKRKELIEARELLREIEAIADNEAVVIMCQNYFEQLKKLEKKT